MADKLNLTNSPYPSKFLRSTRTHLDNFTSKHHLPSSLHKLATPSTSTSTSTSSHHPSHINTSLADADGDPERHAERQEKLTRLAHNENLRTRASTGTSARVSTTDDDSPLSAWSSSTTSSSQCHEMEMGGARKMGKNEVGKLFDP